MSRVDRSRLPPAGPPREFRLPEVERVALPTGLEIRAVEHRTVPLVSLLLLLPGGSALDPPGRPGLAALTADLLDEGSGGRDALEVADRLAQLGAELEIDVTVDAAVVGLTALSRHLAPALELLAEIVASPNLAAEDFGRVRALRLDRLRQLRDHPAAVAERTLARVLYCGHPYGHLSLGTEAALEAVTLEEVRAFHRQWFAPGGATLVVAGDAPRSELAAAAASAMAAWVGSPPPPRDAALALPPLAPPERLVVVPRAGAAQSEVRLGHVCAARTTPDYHALLVLNTILGGQFVSRVNMNLRQEKGFTYGARTIIDFRRSLGPFVLQMSVQTDATAAALREAIGEIAAIRGPRPATAEELQLAQAALTLGYPRGFETAEQVARAVAQLALHGLPDTTLEEFVPQVLRVTGEEVTRVARHYLDPARLVALIVGDADAIADSLRGLNLGEPVVLAV